MRVKPAAPQARRPDRLEQEPLKPCAGCGRLALALFHEPSGWVCQSCRQADRWRGRWR